MFSIATSLFSQEESRQLYDRNTGNLMYLFQHEEIEGNAFLVDRFTTSDLYDINGDVFRNIALKFDTYNNVFSYTKNDTSFQIPESITKVVMHFSTNDSTKDMIFKKIAIANLNNKSKFFQVLSEGSITLLKLYKKEIEEFTEYNNAAKLKRFKKGEVYYIKSTGDFSAVSLNKLKPDVLMQNKWTEIDAFIKQNKLSIKDENGLAKIFSFYNGL